MKIYQEMTLENANLWSGALQTRETILAHDKAREFEVLIENLYPRGLDLVELNDLLWFDSEWVFEMLGINEEEEEEEEEQEDEEDPWAWCGGFEDVDVNL